MQEIANISEEQVMYETHRLTSGLLLAGVVAGGCTTTGTGFGSTASGTDPVTFEWKSSDSVSGDMSATLADGKTYTGQFFQITSDTTVDTLGPLWVGWGHGWRGGVWYDWDPGPEFVTHYSGRVVANLTSADNAVGFSSCIPPRVWRGEGVGSVRCRVASPSMRSSRRPDGRRMN